MRPLRCSSSDRLVPYVLTLALATCGRAADPFGPVETPGESSDHSPGDGPVDITRLEHNVKADGGNGGVSAAGLLAPFGRIGVGAGINWETDQSFGGGMQAGSDLFGLGSGFTVRKDSLDIGMGVKVISKGSSSNITITAAADGSMTIVIASNALWKCNSAKVEGDQGVRCESN